MSEKGDDDDDSANSWSWWNSLYDTAKKKLSETNEFLVRDMKEFTDTVKCDTSRLVASTAASMKEQLNIKVDLDEASHATKVVTKSLTDFLGNVVSHVTPIPPDDHENDESTAYVGTYSGVKVISPYQARVFALQTDPATFCNEPDNAVEFHSWLTSFDLDAKREEISLLMLDFKEVRSLYTKLVPDAVTHVDFWTRYFYKRHELDKAERRRAELVERAEKKETELTWDDEDDSDVIDDVAATSSATDDNRTNTVESAQATDTQRDDLLEARSNDVASDATIARPNDVASDAIIAPALDVEAKAAASRADEPDTGHDASVKDDNSCGEDADGGRLQRAPGSEQAECEEDQSKSVEPHPSSADTAKAALTAADESRKTENPATSGVNSSGCEDGAGAKTKKDPVDEAQSTAGTPPSASNTVTKVASSDSDVIGGDVKSTETTATKPETAQESSSGGSSDWEKEFDLDMTEEEIDAALVGDDTNLDDVNIDDWEEWE